MANPFSTIIHSNKEHNFPRITSAALLFLWKNLSPPTPHHRNTIQRHDRQKYCLNVYMRPLCSTCFSRKVILWSWANTTVSTWKYIEINSSQIQSEANHSIKYAKNINVLALTLHESVNFDKNHFPRLAWDNYSLTL